MIDDVKNRAAKTRVRGIILGLVGAFLCALSVIGYTVACSTGEINIMILVCSIVGTVIGISFLVLGFVLKNTCDFNAKKRRLLYASYPFKKISDYRGELEVVRANFTADLSPDKNKIPVVPYPHSEPFYDFNVIGTGKIVYAHLVEANNQLFFVPKITPSVIPAVVIYSDDEYFEDNPLALKKIAKALYDDKENNVLRNETQYFSSQKVTETLTNGRNVYMSTIMVCREHLPLYFLSDTLFPLIANPQNSTSVFLIDCKYWTNNLIVNFIHGTACNFNNDIRRSTVRRS